MKMKILNIKVMFGINNDNFQFKINMIRMNSKEWNNIKYTRIIKKLMIDPWSQVLQEIVLETPMNY